MNTSNLFSLGKSIYVNHAASITINSETLDMVLLRSTGNQ